jgi:hypothetical protein
MDEQMKKVKENLIAIEKSYESKEKEHKNLLNQSEIKNENLVMKNLKLQEVHANILDDKIKLVNSTVGQTDGDSTRRLSAGSGDHQTVCPTVEFTSFILSSSMLACTSCNFKFFITKFSFFISL